MRQPRSCPSSNGYSRLDDLWRALDGRLPLERVAPASGKIPALFASAVSNHYSSVVTPCLDVLVLIRRRDRATIDSFLSDYADAARWSDHRDEELMIEPLSAAHPPTALDEYDWRPAGTLDDVVNSGVAQPYRTFSIYLDALNPSLSGVALAFTRDGKVVLGVEIDDPLGEDAKEHLAVALMTELLRRYDGMIGTVGIEQAPARDEQEMRSRLDDAATLVFIEQTGAA